ncbi:MAG: hypothetical protein ABW106_09295, partial [Steroidobacteraceae bacterium]
GATVYLKVDNVLNEEPAPSTNFVNPALYDILVVCIDSDCASIFEATEKATRFVGSPSRGQQS